MNCEKCGALTHRDDVMNRRCNSCEHLTRQCVCEPKQNVWRTYSESPNSGYFVWEVVEVMGEPIESTKRFMVQCRDDSWIVINCWHDWSQERALELMHLKDAYFPQTIHYITGHPELTIKEYEELIQHGEA